MMKQRTDDQTEEEQGFQNSLFTWTVTKGTNISRSPQRYRDTTVQVDDSLRPFAGAGCRAENGMRELQILVRIQLGTVG